MNIVQLVGWRDTGPRVEISGDRGAHITMAGTRSWRAQHRYGDMELFTCHTISSAATPHTGCTAR